MGFLWATIRLVVDARVIEIFRVGCLCDVIESKSNQNTNVSTTLGLSFGSTSIHL